MKILLSKAHEYVVPSLSAIYEDARTGKLSTEKDPTRSNKKVVDLAELHRVYGDVRNPKENPNGTEMDTPGLPDATEKLVTSYENRIRDLHRQLELANTRETTLTTEKVKLLDMLSAEQEKNRLLMLPSARENWFARLIGLRWIFVFFCGLLVTLGCSDRTLENDVDANVLAPSEDIRFQGLPILEGGASLRTRTSRG